MARRHPLGEDLEHRNRWLWIGAAIVVLWRGAAVFFPHGADSDPEPVRLAMAPLGLLFTACGLWAFHQAPSRPSLLFSWYGITAGLHWGGPVGFGLPRPDALLLGIYVVVATVTSQALFLHLAFAFPTPLAPASRRWLMAALYLPAALGGLPVPLLLLAPESTGGDVALKALGGLLVLGPLLSLVAGGVWVYRLAVSGPQERRRRRLGLVVGAMVVAFLPHAVAAAGFLPWSGFEGLLDLAFGLVPLALALALARPRA